MGAIWRVKLMNQLKVYPPITVHILYIIHIHLMNRIIICTWGNHEMDVQIYEIWNMYIYIYMYIINVCVYMRIGVYKLNKGDRSRNSLFQSESCQEWRSWLRGCERLRYAEFPWNFGGWHLNSPKLWQLFMGKTTWLQSIWTIFREDDDAPCSITVASAWEKACHHACDSMYPLTSWCQARINKAWSIYPLVI